MNNSSNPRTPLPQQGSLSRDKQPEHSPKSSATTPRPQRKYLSSTVVLTQTTSNQLQNVPQPVVEIFQSRRSLQTPETHKEIQLLERRASSPSRVHSPYKLSIRRSQIRAPSKQSFQRSAVTGSKTNVSPSDSPESRIILSSKLDLKPQRVAPSNFRSRAKKSAQLKVINKDLDYIHEQPLISPLKTLSSYRRNKTHDQNALTGAPKPPSRPMTGPRGKRHNPAHQSFRNVNSSFTGSTGLPQHQYNTLWTPTSRRGGPALSSFYSTKGVSSSRQMNMHETFRGSDKLSTPLSEQNLIDPFNQTYAGVAPVKLKSSAACSVKSPSGSSVSLEVQELPRRVYQFTGRLKKEKKQKVESKLTSPSQRAQTTKKQRKQSLSPKSPISCDEFSPSSKTKVHQLELLLQSPLAQQILGPHLASSFLSNCESLQFIKEVDPAASNGTPMAGQSEKVSERRQITSRNRQSERELTGARNSATMLQPSPSAPSGRNLVPNFTGRTVTGTQSYSTLRRNYEHEKDELDQKIKFIDILLDGQRKQKGNFIVRQPQLKRYVERYQVAKEEVRKAMTLLSASTRQEREARAMKKILGVPIGLQTSVDYTDFTEQQLMRGSMRVRHKEYVGAIRRMGKYFDNYQKSMKVLKTTKANIMLPGEPPLQERTMDRLSPNQTYGTDTAGNFVTLSTPRLLNKTDPVVVPGIASDELAAHRVSVQSTARFSELLDYSCSVRPVTSAAGMYSGEPALNKESSLSIFGAQNKKFETKFSKLAKQSASKFYKQKSGQKLYTHLAQKEQDLSVNEPQKVMLNFSNVEDLKEFFASPSQYLQKKKKRPRSSGIKANTRVLKEQTEKLVSPRPETASKPPLMSTRIKRSFHIPIPVQSGGNLSNEFSGSSFLPIWRSSDVQNLRQERRGSSRTLLNKQKRGTLSGAPLHLQGLLSHGSQLSPNSQEEATKPAHPKRAHSLALARGLPLKTPKPTLEQSNSSLPPEKSDTVLQEEQLVFSFHSDQKIKPEQYASPRMKDLVQGARPSSELTSKEFKKALLNGIQSPMLESFSPRSSSVSGVAPSRITAYAKTQRMEPIPIKDGSEFFSPRENKDGRRNTRVTDVSGANEARTSFLGRGKTASELNRNDSSSTSEFPHLIQRRYQTHRKILQELDSPEDLSSGRTQHFASNVSLIVGEGFLEGNETSDVKGKANLQEVLIPVLNNTFDLPPPPPAPPQPPQTAPQSRMSRGTHARRPQSTKRDGGLKVMLMFNGDVRNSVSSGTGLTGVQSIKSIGHQMQLERPQPRSVSKMSYFRNIRSQRFKLGATTTQSRSITPPTPALPPPEIEQPEDKQLMVSPKPQITSQPESPPPKRRNTKLYKSSELKHLQTPQANKEKKRKEVQAERKIKENLFTTQTNEPGQVTLTAAPRHKSKPRISYLPKKNSDLDFEQFPLQPYKHRMNSERKLEEASQLSSLKKEKTTAYMKKERKYGDMFSLEKYERDVHRKPMI